MEQLRRVFGIATHDACRVLLDRRGATGSVTVTGESAGTVAAAPKTTPTSTAPP
ncbi:hypothetical protein [Streptomyces alfalfae]